MEQPLSNPNMISPPPINVTPSPIPSPSHHHAATSNGTSASGSATHSRSPSPNHISAHASPSHSKAPSVSTSQPTSPHGGDGQIPYMNGASTPNGTPNSHKGGKNQNKIFVGGLSWDTTDETFRSYFSRFGEILESLIMRDKVNGTSRGFGFVTYKHYSSVEKVLKQAQGDTTQNATTASTVVSSPTSSGTPSGVSSPTAAQTTATSQTITSGNASGATSPTSASSSNQSPLSPSSSSASNLSSVSSSASVTPAPPSPDMDTLSSHSVSLELDGRKIECKLAVPKEAISQQSSHRTKKMFIGGVSPETTQETFREYFGTFGPVQEALIMIDQVTGRSRGFGFVTYEHEESVDKVMNHGTHIINDRTVECKKALPKKEMQMLAQQQQNISTQTTGYQASSRHPRFGATPYDDKPNQYEPSRAYARQGQVNGFPGSRRGYPNTTSYGTPQYAPGYGPQQYSENYDTQNYGPQQQHFSQQFNGTYNDGTNGFYDQSQPGATNQGTQTSSNTQPSQQSYTPTYPNYTTPGYASPQHHGMYGTPFAGPVNGTRYNGNNQRPYQTNYTNQGYAQGRSMNNNAGTSLLHSQALSPALSHAGSPLNYGMMNMNSLLASMTYDANASHMTPTTQGYPGGAAGLASPLHVAHAGSYDPSSFQLTPNATSLSNNTNYDTSLLTQQLSNLGLQSYITPSQGATSPNGLHSVLYNTTQGTPQLNGHRGRGSMSSPYHHGYRG